MIPAQERSLVIGRQIKELARLFVERSEELQLKGKKRDDAALDYFVGAAALARTIGQEDMCNRLSILINYTISIKGYIAIQEILNA